ncbi:hypothetical protein FEM41_24090 [Jejubacter calystegiae]|uniref:Bacterial CdiA-CT RNAse A domain-containing protein n=1 Tax=Jejubacter calystegiae TaxID=2579935 RepID=A0A4P8YNQ0_9ENTR|nr:RNase A-like domain-containing protein [Jejubacter calystegiae]QCT22500.1 hypothetical protein FEM41_24090 [Jejubacter calystegiae]
MNESDNGVKIVLSPVQLSAILRRQTIDEGSSLSNRLWGGLNVVGGVIEMFGAGVMCVVPEPTMLSKVGCVVVGAHSMDTISTSFKQVLTGQTARTATVQLSEMTAEKLGADKATAYNVGLTVDLVVPFALAGAAGAARVGAIYTGRIRLLDQEGSRLGHTLSRHVGLDKQALLARLSSENMPHVSTFTSHTSAELLISEVLSVKKSQIEGWLKVAIPNRSYAYTHRFSRPTGLYISRGGTEVQKAYNVRVVLKPVTHNGKPYFILTAFPTP